MTLDVEPRRLRGGPLDGATYEIPPHMRALIAVECPWGSGDVFHFAEAEYDVDGTWVATRCRATDGTPLEQTDDR